MKQKIEKKTEPEEVEKTGRREFLSRIWKLLGLLALAEFLFFTINMLRPGQKGSKNDSAAVFKVAGNLEEYPLNSVTPDRVSKFFLIRLSDGGFLALSLTCSHLGCSVMWDDLKDQFICPCHSSAFDRNGNVINSPAARPLDFYHVIIEGGKVKVDISQKLKRNKFDKSQVTYAL